MNKEFYKDKISEYVRNRPEGGYALYLQQKYKRFTNICVFGAGNLGLELPAVLAGYHIKVDFFCDNDTKKVGKMFCGIPCISLEELCALRANTVVVIATRYYKEIYRQLKELGFLYLDRILTNKFAVDAYFENENQEEIIKKLQQVAELTGDEKSNIVLSRIVQEWCRNEYEYGQLDDICSPNQYFDESVVKLDNDEVFVDCGAYIGDTMDDFLAAVNSKFKKAYLFELSSKNYDLLVSKVTHSYSNIMDKIQPINSGVAAITAEICYRESDEGSGIDADGDSLGQIVALDDYFKGQDVTFIKMDIEGAEKEALEGARQLIDRSTPKLAICLYHKPQDLWELPLFIRQLSHRYRLYIRHYTDLLNETVCYAIISD